MESSVMMEWESTQPSLSSNQHQPTMSQLMRRPRTLGTAATREPQSIMPHKRVHFSEDPILNSLFTQLQLRQFKLIQQQPTQILTSVTSVMVPAIPISSSSPFASPFARHARTVSQVPAKISACTRLRTLLMSNQCGVMRRWALAALRHQSDSEASADATSSLTDELLTQMLNSCAPSLNLTGFKASPDANAATTSLQLLPSCFTLAVSYIKYLDSLHLEFANPVQLANVLSHIAQLAHEAASEVAQLLLLDPASGLTLAVATASSWRIIAECGSSIDAPFFMRLLKDQKVCSSSSPLQSAWWPQPLPALLAMLQSFHRHYVMETRNPLAMTLQDRIDFRPLSTTSTTAASTSEAVTTLLQHTIQLSAAPMRKRAKSHIPSHSTEPMQQQQHLQNSIASCNAIANSTQPTTCDLDDRHRFLSASTSFSPHSDRSLLLKLHILFMKLGPRHFMNLPVIIWNLLRDPVARQDLLYDPSTGAAASQSSAVAATTVRMTMEASLPNIASTPRRQLSRSRSAPNLSLLSLEASLPVPQPVSQVAIPPSMSVSAASPAVESAAPSRRDIAQVATIVPSIPSHYPHHHHQRTRTPDTILRSSCIGRLDEDSNRVPAPLISWQKIEAVVLRMHAHELELTSSCSSGSFTGAKI